MTRAGDVGSEYPSDAADSAPDDPTDGIIETDYTLPVPSGDGSGYISNPLIGKDAYNQPEGSETVDDVSGKINLRTTILYDPYTGLEATFNDILRIITDSKLAFNLDDGRFVQTTDYADEELYLYKPIIATIVTNNLDGTYAWEKTTGDGAESGTARELNGSRSVVPTQIVVLHYAEDEHVFSVPMNVIHASIATEVGLGKYTWTNWTAIGVASGTCYELNDSTGIVVGTVVVLHYIEGYWYFFFPVEVC